MFAVEENAVESVKELIHAKAAVNHFARGNETAMHRAIIKNNYDAVKALVEVWGGSKCQFDLERAFSLGLCTKTLFC